MKGQQPLLFSVVAEDSIPFISNLFSTSPFTLSLVPSITHTVIKEADILICRSTTSVTQSLLHSTSIKYVLTATSGTDHIDRDYLQQRNIVCIDAKGGNAQSVCDYVLSLIAERVDCIHGKTVGIIGVGEVGKRVSDTLSKQGFSVRLSDPFRASYAPNFKHEPLENLTDCAIISAHVPFTKDGPFPTHHLINKAFLQKLLPNTLLINTARGGVFDEKALLNLSTPMMVCLDVFEEEPLPDANILSYCDSATPHIAGHAYEAKIRSSLLIYRKICEHLSISPQNTPFDKLLTRIESIPTLSQYRHYYSTRHETQHLKRIKTKQDFISLRKKHQRHEFTYHL